MSNHRPRPSQERSIAIQLAIALLLLAALWFRIARLDQPDNYVFDEVYQVFTAREYVQGNRDVWDPYAKPLAPGVAYEWIHPPLAKETMAASMQAFDTQSVWAARLPGAFLGVASTALAFALGRALFASAEAGLLSALVFSLDGLILVHSRTGMTEVYLVTFVMLTLLLAWRRQHEMGAVAYGLALASKWTAVYFSPLILVLLLQQRGLRRLWPYLLAPPLVYLASYARFFLTDHSPEQFVELHRQIIHYHANLAATHDYASPWWTWPLSLIPVWYSVDYRGEAMANIFAAGNPGVFWLGALAMLATVVEALRTRSRALVVVVVGYALFWLPNVLSPRILFLYHYAPAVPFLCLALGHQLHHLGRWNRWVLALALALVVGGFLFVYPFLTGVYLPKDAIHWFFAVNQAKNPFAQ